MIKKINITILYIDKSLLVIVNILSFITYEQVTLKK